MNSKLSRLLRELIKLIDEEAGRNPAFAQQLERVTDGYFGPSNKKPDRSKHAPAGIQPPDVFIEYQKRGEQEFSFWLRDLSIPILKAIVKANGFDPAKNSQRWTEPDKFISLITEQTSARLRRGFSFLPPKESS